MFVLRRVGDDQYVRPPGQEHSYTGRLELAHIFATRELALANACGNEYAQDVRDILRVLPAWGRMAVLSEERR